MYTMQYLKPPNSHHSAKLNFDDINYNVSCHFVLYMYICRAGKKKMTILDHKGILSLYNVHIHP